MDCSFYLQNSPSKSIEGGIHSLLQGIFPIQGSSQTWGSCIAGRFFIIWATREALAKVAYCWIQWSMQIPHVDLSATFVTADPCISCNTFSSWLTLTVFFTSHLCWIFLFLTFYYWSSPVHSSSLCFYLYLYHQSQLQPHSPDYRQIYPAFSKLLLGCLIGILNLTYPKLNMMDMSLNKLRELVMEREA